jgi:response regulator RpfG family c-di-GMP phosphodiesterase
MLVDVVAELSDLAQRRSVELALAAIREHVGMDVAFVSGCADEADADAVISAPLRFSDGRRFGSLRAINHHAEPEVGQRDAQYLHVVARLVADQLEREEVEHLARHLQSQAAAVTALRAAVSARDRYTGEHSDAVAEHAVSVGRAMGLDGDDLLAVARIALLHDIGKIAIPDGILHKRAPLTDSPARRSRWAPASPSSATPTTR